MDLLLRWLILSLSVWLTAALLPGFHLRDFKGALIVAAIFGTLNFLVGWLLTFVIGVATLGLGFVFLVVTRWVVTTLLLMMTDALSDHLRIDGFRVAALGALLMTALGYIGERLVHQVH